MGSHREVGGVALAFVGFGFLVLAFKGTWHNVYEALLGKPTGAASSSSSSSPATAASGFPGGKPPANPLAGAR